MKKIGAILVTCLLTMLLAGCGNKVSSGKSDIYKVDVTSTSVNDVGNWEVSGKTNAPDGAKIIAVGPNSVLKDNAAYKADDIAWEKVKNGKFKVEINPIDIVDSSKSKNVKLYLFAITNYHKKLDQEKVPSSYLEAFKSKFDLTTLKLSNSQYKELNSDPDNDDSDTDNSNNDSYQSSLNKRKDNWNSSSDGEIIQVSKVWQDEHTTFVAVNEDDWNSLSETDKDSFTSDWTNSIQDIYKMSDKNGTTSVQVVSSSNHDHMLAHSSGSGSVKIDN